MKSPVPISNDSRSAYYQRSVPLNINEGENVYLDETWWNSFDLICKGRRGVAGFYASQISNRQLHKVGCFYFRHPKRRAATNYTKYDLGFPTCPGWARTVNPTITSEQKLLTLVIIRIFDRVHKNFFYFIAQVFFLAKLVRRLHLMP